MKKTIVCIIIICLVFAKNKRIKLSVEWLVAETPKFHPLFDTSIINTAKEKIDFYQSLYPDQKNELP